MCFIYLSSIAQERACTVIQGLKLPVRHFILFLSWVPFQGFQNLVSNLQGRAIPIFQVEAHMFVHTFYNELQDGSFPGTLRFFWYDRNANSKFEFDGPRADEIRTERRNSFDFFKSPEHYARVRCGSKFVTPISFLKVVFKVSKLVSTSRSN